MKKSRRRAKSYIIEAAVGVAFVYFVLGGSGWSALGWAAFCVLAVAIVVVEVFYGAERLTTDHCWRFGSALVLLFVVALLVGAVWQGSLMLLGIALVMGFLWLDDQRFRRQLKRAQPR